MNEMKLENKAICSGLKEWDEAIGGFVPGQLIVITGRPAMGKTAFAITLLKKLAIIRNIPVAYFSLELTSAQIVMKLLANVFNCTPGYLRGGPQCEVDDNVILAGKVLNNTPLYLDDTPMLSLKDLDSKIAELNSDALKVVIIDYIQLLDGFQKDEELTLSTLKKIAKEHKISLIALSQISKSQEVILSDGSLDVESFRHKYGKAYFQYADIVSVIHRPQYYSREIGATNNRQIAEIHFVKNNHSNIKCIKMNFSTASAKFSAID